MAKYGFVRAIVIAGVCLVGLSGMSARAALAQTVKVHVSSNGGDRLTQKPDVQFYESEDAGGASSQVNGHGNAQANAHDKVRGNALVDPQANTFQVNDAVRYQKMDGFGASIMEAGLMTLNTLPADRQEEVLRALFDAKDGAGFTAMKTPLAGTDFQSAGPWFTYDDIPGDVELKNFSVERDFAPNGVGTYILRARKYGHFALQAPMDYPPDWMLYDVKLRKQYHRSKEAERDHRGYRPQ